MASVFCIRLVFYRVHITTRLGNIRSHSGLWCCRVGYGFNVPRFGCPAVVIDPEWDPKMQVLQDVCNPETVYFGPKPLYSSADMSEATARIMAVPEGLQVTMYHPRSCHAWAATWRRFAASATPQARSIPTSPRTSSAALDAMRFHTVLRHAWQRTSRTTRIPVRGLQRSSKS